MFATDTATTTNSSLPWKNKTTLPKLCQIRDNLHANYNSALFPNDDWMKWEGYTLDAEELQKKKAIQAYMSNKVRESDLRTVASKLVLDYIDYGIAIADVIWVDETKTDPETEEVIAGYVGPRAVRVSPEDIVFDPLATDFAKSPKITRSIKTFGEIEMQALHSEDKQFQDAVRASAEIRANHNGYYSSDDFNKAQAFSVDGFGDLYEYFGSGYVEAWWLQGYDYMA